MLDKIRNSVVLLFAVWMIAASGGYSLFAHHCDCTGNEHVSLIFLDNCRDHNTDAAPSDEGGSCCNTPEEASCPVGQEEDCCKTDQLKFFKTNDYTAPINGDIKPLVIQLTVCNIEKQISIAPEESPKEYFIPPDKRFDSQLKFLLHYTGAYHSALTCTA